MLAAEDQRVKGYVWEFLPRQTVLPDNDGKCESFEKQTNRQVEVKVLNPSIQTAKQLLTWECQCRVCSIIWSKLLNIAPRLWRLHSETDKEAQSPFPYQKDGFACERHLLVGIVITMSWTSLAFPGHPWPLPWSGRWHSLLPFLLLPSLLLDSTMIIFQLFDVLS